MADSFFLPGEKGFVATEATRGPWDEGHQHAGPPAGLIGRALESFQRRDDARVVRVTLEILRPLPIGEIEIEVSLIRPGKRVELLEAAATSAGDVILSARAWRMRTASTGLDPESPHVLFRQWAAVELLPERLPLDALHHQEVHSIIGIVPPKSAVMSAVDLAHASRTEERADLVGPEPGPGRKAHDSKNRAVSLRQANRGGPILQEFQASRKTLLMFSRRTRSPVCARSPLRSVPGKARVSLGCESAKRIGRSQLTELHSLD